MQLTITGKNMEVPERLESYVRRKMGKLGRFVQDPVEVQVELAEENTKEVDQRQVVQVTIFKNGTTVRGEERAAEMRTAVDAVIEKIERQIRRSKDKRVSRKRRAKPLEEITADIPATAPNSSRVARVKRFVMSPMSEDEAIDQMEQLGHSFFLFRNSATDLLNVVYRRDDGTYGFLEPDLT